MLNLKEKKEENFQRLPVIAQKEILSFREALEYLDVSKSFLYKLTSNREIRFTKPNNGKIYFRKSDLDTYMLSNEQKSKFEIEQEVLTKIRQNGKSS